MNPTPLEVALAVLDQRIARLETLIKDRRIAESRRVETTTASAEELIANELADPESVYGAYSDIMNDRIGREYE